MLLLIISFIFISLNIKAQNFNVVDNKGTINTVNNNTVTTHHIEPTNPLEGDVWFDTSDANHIIKIWDADALPTPTWTQFSNQNIYTQDGTLDSNRLVIGDNNTLGFTNLSAFQIYGTNFISFSATNFFDISVPDGALINLYGNTRMTKNLSIEKNLSLTGTFADTTGDVGTNGQVLSSTGTGTKWIDNSKKAITTTATNFTLNETHHTLILNNTSAITISIPDASSAKGQVYIIKTNMATATLSKNYIDANRNTVTAFANLTIYQLQSDGTNWQQIN
ncbi:hypothetical protein [Tenacibaculum finnmarkense]|uniref:hypothetical protein n=1 Tax=Tenacibaculum finnmarkense TaxID=2781243 RepID=UPI001E364F35|nr:hypothetical protein [Tenacibaculum finnmarkense]MCD8411552.1 hypothetical protein [Tenacibaculum finnmarkense genomovar ulcerans]